LRENPALLSDLREKLFILWGDLEERKRAPDPDPNKQIASASTKPFICCIKEFGVKISCFPPEDDTSADEEECRFGWKRRFCMFGTTIV
ncbi:hypothetical protein ACJ72_08806, partial [Emergomyces africanus]